jgi:dTDP-4-amino-4,6-dideoxygalactose transaminase
VIMPSYAFVSTANAFVLRGGIPVFIDIRPDTMNMDETLIEAAITDRTKAIVPIHYAGVACEMEAIMEIACRYSLLVIEDAAHAIGCGYRGKSLGSIGQLGAISFHETKNITSGEAGAIIVNIPELSERAEVVWHKGTNRNNFIRGEIDKYSWVDIGSSYQPGELIAAFLLAQMEKAEEITAQRLQTWNLYYDGLKLLAEKGLIEMPIVPTGCHHNAHLFYIKTADRIVRKALIDFLKKYKINSVFHYIPLHSSKGGCKYSRFHGVDQYTTRESERLLRLPLHFSLSRQEVDYVISKIHDFFLL